MPYQNKVSYSVMGKDGEKVKYLWPLHLKEIRLSRFNGTSRVVFCLRWMVIAFILSLSASVVLASSVKAESKPLQTAVSKSLQTAVPLSSQTAEFSRATMTAPTALRKIREGLQKGSIQVNRGSFFGCVGVRRYENINVTFTQLSFTEVEECQNSRYNSPPTSELLQFSKPSDWRRINGLGNALGFSDAVNAVKYYASGSDVADGMMVFTKFQEEASAWRALPVKPVLPEALRRFKTLAEDAIQNKNFEKAIDYYEQGLEVSPLWPEGQFNAALLYGELQIYGQAMLHMKRYLELSPDAKDAQAARDQIIIWQSKLQNN